MRNKRYKRYTKDPKKTIGLYVDQDFWALLDAKAKKKGMSLSFFLVKELEDKFNYKKEEE